MNRILNRVVMQGLAAIVAFAPIVVQPALADDTPTSSQTRMTVCSKRNKGMKGDEYKAAQSACLKGSDTAAAAPQTQQQKMAACSKANKGKKGDDYKKAQSDCLKA